MSVEEKNWTAKNYSRRRFLANAAKLAGAALAYPVLSTPLASAGKPPASASKGTRKVGVLLPSSASYSGVVTSFLAGMNLYLQAANRQDVALVVPEACSPMQSCQKAETLLKAERIDLIAGMLTPNMAASIAPFLEASNAVFVASTLGENLPRTAQRNPHIFHYTLGLWQANWALGRWSALNLGRRALVASSFRDSGYDMLYAFQAGFESAGGRVLASEITHRPQDRAGVGSLISRIQATRPDVVFASYYGQSAIELLSAYDKAGLAASIPLVGTAYLTDAPVLAAVGRAAMGVRTAFSWAPGLSTHENDSFARAYGSATGKAPNGFALLGYETANLVVGALDRSAMSGSSLREAIASASFVGPRGQVSMDSHTQSTVGPLYMRQVRYAGGALDNVVIGELDAVAERDSRVARLASSQKTGWLNTYLCD
ncbi:MAG: ABC transporter substrate-binding protein [Chloroflexia bacterium]